MTAPIETAATSGPWYGRPRIMVPLLLGIAILTALLTPERANRNLGDARLTTRESTPMAASLAAELPKALGWRVSENTSGSVPERRDMVHLVLAPAAALRASEVHVLLERVRSGAGLFVITFGERDLLRDSLHLAQGPGGRLDDFGARGLTCPDAPVDMLPWLTRSLQFSTINFTAPPPPRLDTILRTSSRDTAARAGAPVLLGFRHGEGRVVVATDPDLLRNDALRQCDPGLAVAYVRALEYLRDTDGAQRRWLLFDEYHQGFGVQPGTARAVITFFADTVAGHVLAQLAFAGLLLLLMRMPRLVPPPADGPVERRSPIEHVDALSRAYIQVGATRTATQRLVRGVRRRLERGTTGGTTGGTARGTARGTTSLSDDAWLERAGARAVSLRAPVTLARRSLREGHPARDFTAVGDALATIEQTLRQDPR